MLGKKKNCISVQKELIKAHKSGRDRATQDIWTKPNLDTQFTFLFLIL